MNSESIAQRINTCLAEEFELEPDQLKPEAHLFDDLELDSLDIVDLVVVLESEFQFKIREEEKIREIRTLRDIYNFVVEKHNAFLDAEV